MEPSNLSGSELNVDMNFTVAGQTQLGRQLDPGINRNTVEGFLEIELGISDFIRTNLILIKDVEVELVLTAFRQVESEGLVPDGIVTVFNDRGTLLVVFVNP